MNTKNNIMFKNSSKMVTLLILGFCLLSPLMAVGQDGNAEPISTTRCPVYDLKIIKAVDSTIAAPGSILTYTILVKNQGEGDVENVLVKDGIPIFTTYIQGSATNNGVYLSAYNQIEWEIDLLKAGTSIEVSYQAQIDPGTPNLTEIRNTAKIALPEIIYSNLVITKVKIEAKPKLEIIKQVDKTTALASDTLHYTMTVSNNGDARAYYTDIVDDIPEFTTYIAGSATNGTYDANFNRLNWYIEYLWPGESVDFNFLAIIDSDAPAQTQIANIGTIILESGNISDTVITTVLAPPAPELDIIKKVDKSTAYAGDTLTYTLSASNTGDIDDNLVTIADKIPQNAFYVPGSVTGGAVYNSQEDQIEWSGTISAHGSTNNMTFKVIVNKSTPAQTIITNIGSIILPDSLVSDTAYTTIELSPGPKLFIDKSVDKSTAYNGDTLTYYLDISNYGGETAENAQVVDNIPDHTTYIPGSAIGGSYDASLNQVSWNLPYVPQGIDVSMLRFEVVIDRDLTAATTITNVGTVTYDDKSDWDDAETEVSVHPGPRVYIDKSVDKSSAYNGDTLTYYLDISNYGGETAENAQVVDNIPDHTTYIPGSAIGGSYDATLNQVSWDLSTVPQGIDVSMLRFEVVIDRDLTAATTITNVGTVTYDDKSDWDDAETEVSVHPGPKLYIEKKVDKADAYAGDTLTYTLIVSNFGATVAEDVNVEDYIPELTTYVPGTAFGGTYNTGSGLLTWTVDYIEARNPAYLSFRAVIDKDARDYAEIINTGSVVLPDDKISDDVKTTVLPSPTSELTIIKRVDLAAAFAGDTLTYTLNVTNIGEETARNIGLEDYIPDFTSYVIGSASNATYDNTNDLLNWQIDYIDPGITVGRSFKAVIDSNTPVQTEIVNTGSIVLPDGKKSDDAKTTILPIPEPVLDIVKSVNKPTAFAGDTLTYTVVVSNLGDANASIVEVEDFMPSYTTYIPGSLSDGTYDAGSKRLSWIINNLNAGAASTKTFGVTIDEGTPDQTEIENIGSILLPDESKLSDTANTTVLVKMAPQLDIRKVVDLATAYAGDTLTYTITISNTGNADDEDVWITDPIPQNAIYIDGSVTGGGDYNAQAGTVNWNISVPAGGSSPDLTFRVMIDEATPGQTEIENIGSILLPDESMLSDTARTIVQDKPTPQLDIRKVVDLATAYAGDTLTYTITISNTGEVADEAVWVTDLIPQNVTYVDGSVTAGGNHNSQAGIVDWNISVPAGGSSPDLTFKVTINEGIPDQTLIRNIGSILYPDETLQSDTAQTVVQAGPSPYLDIAKDVDKPTAYAGDTLTYTISVSNTGEVADEAVWVTDLIPQNVTYVDGSVTVGGNYNSQAGIIDWNISVPAGGSSPDLTFKVTINEVTPAQTEIENIGSILFPDDSKLSDTVKTVVLETLMPNIEVSKQVDSLIASPGSILTYSLEFTNTGNTPITQITAWDKLPNFTSYVNGSATAGGTYNETDNQVNWNWQVGSIAPGHSIDLSFEVQIDGDAKQGARITNIGSAALPVEQFVARKLNGDQYETLDTVHSNPVITIVDIKTGEDDLTILKEVSAVYTAPGNILNYNLTITNSGEETLNNIVFTDTIPSHTDYVPGSATGGAIYDGTNSSLTWTISSLGSGESVKYQFDVKVDADAPDEAVIFNQAFITEPIAINGNIVMTTVLRERMLVVKSVDKSQVTIGDTLTYTVTYTNNSLADVDNVIIIDTLITGLNYIPGSATSGGLYNPINKSLIWRIRTVPAGSSGSVSFSVEIDESVPNADKIENFVIFSGDDIPIDTSNLVIVTVTFPEMVMSKTVDQVIAFVGDTVTYTINALNDGAGPLNNSVVIDTLPENFEYVSGTVTVNGVSVTVTGSNILSIPIGTLAAAETAEIIYDVAIMPDADQSILHVNSAILRGTNNSGQTEEFGPVQATVSLQSPRLTITKTAEVTSSIAGSFVPFKVTITNIAIITVEDVIVTDSMASGFFYVEGSSTIDASSVGNPNGTNPYEWFIGDISPGQTITLRYITQLGTSVSPGPAENIAWAAGRVGGESVRTTNVMARVNVVTTNIPGAIRGRIIVDCDGDGIADIDSGPTGIDIYLDDGSNSRVNEKGMFYFGTVRAGEHLVALDIRDLVDYELAEGQDGSVLVYVHEGGESYITFRICPSYPKLLITKEAAILPKIKVSKTAILSDSMITDSNTVTINYDILIESSSGVPPGEIIVVDSFPDETRMVIFEGETRDMSDTDKVFRYTIGSSGQKYLKQTVSYLLDDLDLDSERFLTNNLYLEGIVNVESKKSTPIKSGPVELSVGPFHSVSAGKIEIKTIAAHFVTAMVYLQDKDLSPIARLADSIAKYPGLNVKVEGHADYRPIHTKRFPSNWELSTARAKSVVDRFTGFYGLDSSIFTYEGFAATRPIDSGHTEASWWKNRRAEVILSGSIKGGIEFSGDLNQKWSQSTLLELGPMQWDTLLSASEPNSESDLINTWEISITINNIGPGKAGKVVIEDLLPNGAVYEEGSVSVNGRKVSAKVDADNNLIIGSGDIPEGNSVEIRYRIQAAEKSTIIGGGKAVVEIEHRHIGVVKQESNPIRFY